MSDLSKNLIMKDGQLITAAMLIKWLETDQVAMSLFEGYLAAYKAGLIAHQGAKNAPYSSFKHKPNNDFA